MRNISLRDLMYGVDSLSDIKSEIDLINPANDERIKAVLEEIGFNTKQGIDYIPSNHRDMRNNVAVGFQVVGEYNTDPSMKHFLDTTDRIVVAGMTDVHLAKDMAELMGKRYTYKNQDEDDIKERKRPNDPRYYSEEELIEMGYTSGNENEIEYDDVETNCDSISSQIAALQIAKELIRGNV